MSTVGIPAEVLQDWGIADGTRINIHIGLHRISAQVKAIKDREGILLSADIKGLLGLKKDEKVRLGRKNQAIFLGPVMGILTTGISSVVVNGSRSRFFSRFCKASEQFGVKAFVFGASDVDFSNRRIRGYQYVKGHWEKHVFPLPNVVYNRVPNRTSEKRPEIKLVKKGLKDLPGLQFFNPGYFDKWQLYRLLSPDEEISKYLPETRLLKNKIDLLSMLQKHGMVYLKPVFGTLGLGIIRLTLKNKQVYIDRKVNEKHTRTVVLVSALPQLIGSLIAGRRYVIQQGVYLSRYKGRNFDVRITMQRNEQGIWVPVIIGAKIAAPNGITTHVHNGGSVRGVETVFNEVFGNRAETYLKWMVEISARIGDVLEERLNSPVGEIGLDFGIDVDGHVWVFEANSKPGRMVFNVAGGEKARRDSYRLIPRYALYLSGMRGSVLLRVIS